MWPQIWLQFWGRASGQNYWPSREAWANWQNCLPRPSRSWEPKRLFLGPLGTRGRPPSMDCFSTRLIFKKVRSVPRGRFRGCLPINVPWLPGWIFSSRNRPRSLDFSLRSNWARSWPGLMIKRLGRGILSRWSSWSRRWSRGRSMLRGFNNDLFIIF